MRNHLFIFILMLIFANLYGQRITIKDQTSFDFKTIEIFHERESKASRNVYEYDEDNRWQRKGNGKSLIVIDTIPYSNEIEFKEDGVYTLKFVDEKDSVFFVFGFNTTLSNELFLNTERGELVSVEEEMYELGKPVYFGIVNRTDLTIYSIKPKVSDEENYRSSILYNDPDRKLIPGEGRFILVLPDFFEDTGQTIDFEILGVNPLGEVVRFNVTDIGVNRDHIHITSY